MNTNTSSDFVRRFHAVYDAPPTKPVKGRGFTRKHLPPGIGSQFNPATLPPCHHATLTEPVWGNSSHRPKRSRKVVVVSPEAHELILYHTPELLAYLKITQA